MPHTDDINYFAMDIKEIMKMPAEKAVAALMSKAIVVQSWSTLVKEYDTKYHPVMDQSKYPDIVNKDGSIDYVTRVPIDLIKVTVKRMTELVCGIPVKRIYRSQNDMQKEIASALEKIFQRTRIDSMNVNRLNMLFASCEVATLWYAVKSPNTLYGFDSDLKLRCVNYSPMAGDEIFPLFDEYGDLIALSFRYRRRVGTEDVTFFDTYTSDAHRRWKESGSWELEREEYISIGKIPGIYMFRPNPIQENNAPLVYEMEWALSRSGNYLRKNSKPILALFADEQVNFGEEKDEKQEFKSVFQYPAGSDLKYVTWPQAIEGLKFHVQELRQTYFSSLQMPDFSMDNMKTSPMSGEARKMVFIDAQLKVKDESGRILEFLDREVNVVKAFLKVMKPEWASEIDALQVENVITPFTINDESETINNLVTASGGKAIISQREAVESLGWSEDPDRTLQQIALENAGNAMAL